MTLWPRYLSHSRRPFVLRGPTFGKRVSFPTSLEDHATIRLRVFLVCIFLYVSLHPPLPWAGKFCRYYGWLPSAQQPPKLLLQTATSVSLDTSGLDHFTEIFNFRLLSLVIIHRCRRRLHRRLLKFLGRVCFTFILPLMPARR